LLTLALTPLTLPADTVNVAYSQTITTSAGSAATLAVTNIKDAIPGMTVPSSGTNGSLLISGTPTAAGTETFKVTATEGSTTKSLSYSLVVNPAPSFTPATLPGDTVNIAYNQTITTSGGTGTVALAVSNIQNPIQGLNVSPSGTGSLTIGGTPQATGTETFTVTAEDTVGATASATYSITVNPPVGLSAATLPEDTAGLAYEQVITADGGTNPTLAASNITSNLPNQIPIPGLTLTGGTGSLTISGTPTEAGTETFTVTATDSVGSPPGTASATYSITVNPAISFVPTTLPGYTLPGNGEVFPNGQGSTPLPYNQTITTSGGTGTVTLTLTNIVNSSSLPLVPSGSGSSALAISGTPTTTGTETFTVSATDSVGATATENYTITVGAPISFSPTAATLPAILPAGVVGAPYAQSISESGGTGPVSLAVASTSGPNLGLTVTFGSSLTPTFSGTPTAFGTEIFNIQATDALGVTETTSYSITVNPVELISTAGSVADLIGDIMYCNQNPGTYQISLGSTTYPNDPSTYPLYAPDVANSNTRTNPSVPYGATGLPYITSGDNLTIVGNGADIEPTKGDFRLFAVAPEGSLTLENLTLEKGWADARYASSPLPAAASEGGAIYVDSGGTLTLSGVTITNNYCFGTYIGSGPAGEAGEVAAGGGIYSNGTVNLQFGTAITNNTVYAGNAGYAGAGLPGLPGGNAMGGGICVVGGSLSATSGVIVSNNTLQAGMGGWGDDANGTGGNSGNAMGGGIYASGANVSLSGATLTGNCAYSLWAGIAGKIGPGGTVLQFCVGTPGTGGNAQGGGLYASAGTVSLSGCTITSNSVGGGQGGSGYMCATKKVAAGVGGLGGDGQGGGLYLTGATTPAGVTIPLTVTMTGNNVSANTAVGGAGGLGGSALKGNPGKGGTGGDGCGGGLYIASGATVTLSSGNSIASNVAAGGGGGSGGFTWNSGSRRGASGHAGNAYGGGLYAAAGGTLTIYLGSTYDNSITGNNAARGDSFGSATKAGTPGTASGGGLYIVSGATVTIDYSPGTTISTYITGNDTNGTTESDIVGSYTKVKL
jgi:hypothetical protein